MKPLLPLPVLLFCICGAMASLEPANGAPIHTGWLIGYCLVGMAALASSLYLLRADRLRGQR